MEIYKVLVETKSNFKYLKFDRDKNTTYFHIKDSQGFKYRVNRQMFNKYLKGDVLEFIFVGKNNPYSLQNMKILVEEKSEFKLVGIIKGNKEYLFDIEDSEGYRYRTTKGNFVCYLNRKQSGFSKVGKSQYYSKYNINRFLKINNVNTTLLTENWDGNATSQLSFKCQCEDFFTANWNVMSTKKKILCNNCTREIVNQQNQVWDEKSLKLYVESKNEFKFLKYERNGIKSNGSYVSLIYIHLQDKNGYKYRVYKGGFEKYVKGEINSFKFVDRNNPYSIENIEIFLNVNRHTYQLISRDFKGSDKKLTLKCTKHGECSGTWASLSSGKNVCYDCYIESISGENNYLWNHDLTYEERIIRRDYPEYQQWRKSVFERDNYTCQCCDSVGHRLNAHHLDSYDWATEKRTDVDNGVTLCKTCHTSFHSTHGYGNNTKEQFENYIINHHDCSHEEYIKQAK